MNTTNHLRATAYHEAGHVVVALWGGDRKPRQATIVPTGDTLGSLESHPWASRFRPDIELTPTRVQQLQARIDALLAGVIAERRGTGRRHNWTGAASDLHQATDLAGYLNGSIRQLTLYLAWRERCVRDGVESRWPDIERVAEALLIRRTLDGDELTRIVFQLPPEGSWVGKVPPLPTR
jgi:ATP-dependent Zn protease